MTPERLARIICIVIVAVSLLFAGVVGAIIDRIVVNKKLDAIISKLEAK